MESESSKPAQAWASPTLVYLTVTLGLVLLVKYLFTSRAPENIPPFPVRPYPLLGHLPYLGKGVRHQMTKWTKTTGDIFSLYFGPKLVVILSSYEVLHQAYVKHSDTLSDRPILRASATGHNPNTGIAGASGKLWKEQRSISLHILRSFGMGKNILAEKVSEEVSAYLDALSKQSSQAHDVAILTKNAVSNVICSIIVGKRFDYDDDYYVTFLAKMTELIRLSDSLALFTMFPWLRHLPGDLFSAKKRTELQDYILKFFCHHYINKAKAEDEELNRENFISAYLLQKRRLEENGQDTTLDDENLCRIIFELFLAGTDTTSTAIMWFILYMVHYPEIQERIFAEISKNVGLDREPNMQDKTKLNLLVATIMETQRINITPIVLPHCTSKDTVIKGYTIPVNTWVLSFQDSYSIFEDAWKEPMKYKPERFLDDQGNVTQPDQFLPFGIGRRACPGEALAKMELFLFLSSLIQRFELQPEVPGQLPSLEPVEGLVYYPKPFKVRFVDRRGL